MVALVQRVKEARVEVNNAVVGEVGPGLLILLGVHVDDTQKEADWLAKKCTSLRIFPDEKGLMNESVLDCDGEILVVSQFTLYGNTRKGNRPSFVASAPPDKAEPLYLYFVQELEKALGKKIPTGVFGAHMDVHLVNDGPVTLWVEKMRSV